MTVMPAAARSDAIEKALESEDAKRDAERRFLPWKDGQEKCTVIEIELAAVILNPRSHRIRAQLESHPLRDQVLSDPESLDSQLVIAGLLSSTEGFADIKASLEAEGQREPGVVTRAGVLVNGNTRAVAMRELGNEYIRLMVLPKNATQQQISELELRLQVRREFKQEYTFTNQLLFVKECLEDAGWTFERVAGEVGYETRFGSTKGVEKVRQDDRVLAMIGELREMSNRRYSYSFFDDAKQALEEIDKEFEQLKRSDPEAALRLRNARMIGILSGLGYRELRHVDSDFVPQYLEPEIADDDDLALFAPAMLGATSDVEPSGLDLLGGGDGEDDSSTSLLRFLTQTAGNQTVSTGVQGKRFSRPRDEIVEAIRGAMENGVVAAKEDNKREDLIEQPSKRLQEARQKVKSAAEAFRRAKSDPRFDDPRLKKLKYKVRKVSGQITDLEGQVEGEITKRNQS